MRLCVLAVLAAAASFAHADWSTYYVSSSNGSDANDGLSEARPLRTIEAGYRALRNLSGDHLSLQRGSVWVDDPLSAWEGTNVRGCWNKSGASETDRLTVGAYGDGPRPLLITRNAPGGQGVVRFQSGGGVSHVTIHDIDARQDRPSTSTGNVEAVSYWSTGGDVVIERVRLTDYSIGVHFDSPGTWAASGLVARFVVVDRSFPSVGGPHSQGFYVNNIDGWTIDSVAVDSAGCRPADAAWPGSGCTIFNHGVYAHQSSKNGTVRNSFFSRCSATAIQARGNRTDVIGNVCIANPLGITTGHAQQSPGQKSSGVVWGNLVVDSGDIGTRDPKLPRGFGIGVGMSSGLVVSENIVTAGLSQHGLEPALSIGDGLSSARIVSNYVAFWRGPAFAVRSIPGTGVEVSGNWIQQIEGGTVGAIEIPSVSSPHPSLHGNLYHVEGGSPFTINSRSVTFDEWSSATGEPISWQDQDWEQWTTSDLATAMGVFPGADPVRGLFELAAAAADRGESLSPVMIQWARDRWGLGPIPAEPVAP